MEKNANIWYHTDKAFGMVVPKLLIGFFLLCAVAFGTYSLYSSKNNQIPSGTQLSQENIASTDSGAVITDNPTVPKPTEEDVISLFFSLIQEKKISDAIMLLTSKNIATDSDRQAWGVQLNTLKSIKIVSISPWNKENWNQEQRQYKVIVSVTLDSSSASSAIPYFGWQEPESQKWITIVAEDGVWKIDSIASGP